MADPKVFLDKSVKPDRQGRYPVKIDVSISGVRKKKTLFPLHSKNWDEKKSIVKHAFVDNVKLNHVIEMSIRAIKDYIYVHGYIQKDMDLSTIIYPETTIKAHTITSYLKIYADSIKEKASKQYYGNIIFLISKIDELSPGITVDRITEEWINIFYSKCQVSESTFAGYMKKIRKALKIAQRDKVVICQDAFAYKVKIPKKIRHKLSIDQFHSLVELKFAKGNKIGMVRDIFLLQIYCRGMRIGDLLVKRFDDIKGDRLSNTQAKTGSQQDIKLSEEALEIIEKYKDNPTGYLVPFLKIQPEAEPERIQAQISSKTTIINAGLDVIAQLIGFDYPLTSHVARHTYAVLGKQMGIPIYILSKHLGHSNIHTTEVYLAELMETDVLDAAADDLFKKLKKK